MSNANWELIMFSRIALGKLRSLRGFSAIELLVTLGLISILAGILLPAAQYARESARSTGCKSNLRQLGLAAQNYETAHSFLPGPWFNAPPDSVNYSSDRGLFVQLLPLIEESNRYDVLRASPTTFDPSNAALLSQPIRLLTCPSASADPTRLTDIAVLFSAPAVPGNSAVTCDYIGNGGYIPIAAVSPDRTDGPIGVQIPGSSIPNETMARTSDGLSNTILLWESIGSTLIFDTGVELDINAAAGATFVMSIYGPPAVVYPSSTVASTKCYLYSWAGIRLGNMRATSGRIVNVGNTIGQPYSRHPAGANAVLVDGSVKTLTRDLSPEVGFALASSRGREVVSE